MDFDSQNNITELDIKRAWCLSSTLNFTRYFFKANFNRKFIIGHHHKLISDKLDDVLTGKIKKLIINIAPRYGKTELAVKNFIAEGLALNPKSKFIHLSYSDDLALDNSAGVQDILRLPEYQELFAARMATTGTKKWETIQGGGLYAVSSSGQVTGFGAGLVDEEDTFNEIGELIENCNSQLFGGAIVIDDPIKPDDALSEAIRDKVNNKFDTTIRNRVNSRNTPIIIIMQRLHENDLCGYLLKQEPDEWEVLSLPCIYEDGQGEEQALWPFKHTLDELHALREKNSYVFDTQYMQDPKPIEGLMYDKGFKTYEVIPYSLSATKKNYTDTADTGKDYLCSICYDELPEGNFITDVLYTKKPMEFTEPKTAEMLTRNQTKITNVESNNGGRGFARAVEKQLRQMDNNKTSVLWFTQTNNKQVRIFSKSAEVMNLTYFPVDWEARWPEFARHLLSYRKEGNNKYDDAEDCLTGTVEKRDVLIGNAIEYDKDDLGL